jgi:hypothetical protein
MDAAQALEVNRILLSTMAAALVVLAGALYAAVYAIGKMADNRGLVRLSYLFYAVLVVGVLILARSLEFSGVWNVLAVVLMIAYYLAPHAIWRLCVGTHADGGVVHE